MPALPGVAGGTPSLLRFFARGSKR
jgi:hypothetical protein